jgi:LysM repeat protein
MVARNPGRYLAPVALAVAIVATVVVIESGLGSAPHAAPPVHLSARHQATTHAPAPKRFYVVQAGDSLSAISVKTGVPIPTLESLNPSVSPNALQTGQRLRVRQ